MAQLTFTPSRKGGRRSWRATAANGTEVGYSRSRNSTGFTWWACRCSAEGTYGSAPTEGVARSRAITAAAGHPTHV